MLACRAEYVKDTDQFPSRSSDRTYIIFELVSLSGLSATHVVLS